VGLCLGIDICEPHPCVCGQLVDARGSHALSCKRTAGRLIRHNHLNDIICRSMTRAAIPASKEPTGLVRSDGKRPDGLSLIPWREGRCLVWDVTVADTTAASYLHSTSVTAGSAAESAARRKETKYTELSHRYEFVPIAMETHGPLDAKAATSTCFRDFQWLYSASTLYACPTLWCVRPRTRPICDMCLHQLLHMN
jgi:hypothetical protein